MTRVRSAVPLHMHLLLLLLLQPLHQAASAASSLSQHHLRHNSRLLAHARRAVFVDLSGGASPDDVPPSATTASVLRVRLPDGSTKRVKVEAADTIAAVISRATGARPGAPAPPAAFLDPRFQRPIEDSDAPVADLGLENGAMLYCQKAARKAAGGEGSDLFAEREKQGKAAVRTRDFEQLSKEQHAVKVERQAKPNCTRLSLDRTTSQKLAVYFAERSRAGAGKEGADKATTTTTTTTTTKEQGKKAPSGPACRVALLFGRSATGKSKDGDDEVQVSVDAMWEPPQGKATAACYDIASLVKAAKGPSPAMKVASALGYRLVGWLFSHGPRDHFLSAQDIAVTATLRRATAEAAAAAGENGEKAGAELVVVAVRDAGLPSTVSEDRVAEEEKGKEDVTFEAYQVSNQAYGWFKDGVLRDVLSEGAAQGSGVLKEGAAAAAVVPTTKTVIADGKSTKEVDSALFTVPVPILAHKGPLRCTFPPPNRPELKANTRLLKRALFTGPERLESRLADFALLLYLHKRLPSIEPLVECAVGSTSKELPPYYRTLLEELVESVST
jgi:hypothetical protein